MIQASDRKISIRPVVNYPRHAEPNKSYLLEVDLQPIIGDLDWPYDDEEYVVYCNVDAGTLFDVEAIGESTIVVHRFGGTYGAAKFSLTATSQNRTGDIKILLISGWGEPLDQIILPEISVAPSNHAYHPDVVERSRLPGQQPFRDRSSDLSDSGDSAEDRSVAARVGGVASQLVQLAQAYKSGILDEDTYRKAVTAFSSQLSETVAASGSGAAAGQGGVAVAGDIHGNVYTGPEPNNPETALAIYRRVFAVSCRQLPLRGVDVGSTDPQGEQKQLNLDHVYVSPNTTTRIETDEDEPPRHRQPSMELAGILPLSALEAAHARRRLVLTGDPGSGKSTFVNHLGLCLAMHGLEPKSGWLDKLEPWSAQEVNLLPVTVILRDFARFAIDEGVERSPSLLWPFICNRLKQQNLDFVAEHLHDRLEMGDVYLLLDGLDEIAQPSQRKVVRDAIAAFAQRYDRCRILVTCRTLSYQDPAWRLPSFPSYELAPFDRSQIGRFVDAWYAELHHLGVISPDEATRLTARLQAATQRTDLRRLASNPLLLTVMALVHTHKGRLPDARALLYEETVDILLWRWEQVKAGNDEEQPGLRGLLLDAGRTDVDLKKVLWRLAFDAHGEGGIDDDETLADISEMQLVKSLAALHPNGSLDWAQRVTDVIKLRAGLLVERAPEVYTFPDRAFQEYLAGAHLSTQAGFAQRATALLTDGPFWWQVILLAVGRLVYLSGDADKPLALVGELCPVRAVDNEDGWRRAWLAGEVMAEITPNRVRDSVLGIDLIERVRRRLIDLLQADALQPVERARAITALGELGDPRDFNAMIEVPAGEFGMGSSYYENEKPKHRVDVLHFHMAKYPVTNGQYAQFVAATGRTAPEHWRGDQSPPDLRNHPVVNVSWYDAQAYCDWLSQQRSTPVRLPSEAEWEKAAKGTDQRTYPWGDNYDPEYCNTRDTGIGQTSPVGIFQSGSSPYGCLDMSGNVWEWTTSLWGKDTDVPSFRYPYDPSDGREAVDAPETYERVARGGSFAAGDRLTALCDAFRIFTQHQE